MWTNQSLQLEWVTWKNYCIKFSLSTSSNNLFLHHLHGYMMSELILTLMNLHWLWWWYMNRRKTYNTFGLKKSHNTATNRYADTSKMENSHKGLEKVILKRCLTRQKHKRRILKDRDILSKKKWIKRTTTRDGTFQKVQIINRRFDSMMTAPKHLWEEPIFTSIPMVHHKMLTPVTFTWTKFFSSKIITDHERTLTEKEIRKESRKQLKTQ